MKFLLYVLVVFTIFMPLATFAGSLIEPDYDGDTPKITTPWYEYYSPENQAVDQAYMMDMRPHHSGALTMAEKYLTSDQKSSQHLQALSKGIIRNQAFEIMILDMVKDHLQEIVFENGAGWYQVATQGLAMRDRFIRSPVPPVQSLFHADDQVSKEDVHFAKAMIVHHEGALMMARDYLANLKTNNTYLERLNLDILRDQAQEIQLMYNIIAAYPGDPCEIKITTDMIDGMDNMMHHMDFSSVNCAGPKHVDHHHH